MKEKYEFFYDESEHSRKINKNTIAAPNYYENFVTVIVGWKLSDSERQKQKYLDFEEKYKDRKSKGELKSTTIKNNQLEYGFASLNSQNIEFLKDYLNLFDTNTFIYFSAISKFEYIINQLFIDYNSEPFVDVESMKYTIVKAVVNYKPEKVINGLFENTNELVLILKEFFLEQIAINENNPVLKKHENLAFNQVIEFLDRLSHEFEIDWEYRITFTGFLEYLTERSITDYKLYIDQEGRESLTAKGAENVGLKNVSEIDSIESYGVRWADMLVGLIAKLLKSIHKDLAYTSLEDFGGKKILSEKWFNLNNEQLELYKQLDYILNELNNAWFKTYAGIYADDFLTLLTLINFMTQFSTTTDLKESKNDLGLPEQFNSVIVSRLQAYFQRMKLKIPIKVVPEKEIEQGYVIGKYGQKIYIDEKNQPQLKLKEGGQTFKVLTVGIRKSMVPSMTIMEGNKAVCFLIPNQLTDWVVACIGYANMNQNPFPANVMLTKNGDDYYANIL